MYIRTSYLQDLLETDLRNAGWDGAIGSYPGQTTRQFAMMAQAKSLCKKYLPGTASTTQAGDKVALDLFLESNEKCRVFDLDQPRTEIEEIALGESKSFLYDFFFPRPTVTREMGYPNLDPTIVITEVSPRLSSFSLRGAGCGKGSALGADSESFYSKFFTSKLTCTKPDLYDLYVQTISSNPLWLAGELARKSRGWKMVSGNRLSFVPKEAKKSRVICTEPILEMFFQKCIEFELREGLLSLCNIDLTTQQDRNRALAQRGSITGQFCTIDLKDASNSLSRRVTLRHFPRHVVNALELARCEHTILPDGSLVELHMISSMGNAYTFPLQTLFYLSLVVGAYRALDIPVDFGVRRAHLDLRTLEHRGPANLGVYGDDIICDARAAALVTRLLFLTGFTVNHDKSFYEGPFRESCGADFMNGINVRGVFLEQLRDASDCYSAINRLNRWSAVHCIALPSLVQFLSGKCRFLPIPPEEDPSSGVFVPWPTGYLPRKRKASKHVHLSYYKVAVFVPNAIDVSSSGAFEEALRERRMKGFFNPDGILLSFIAGYIRDARLVLRSTSRRVVFRERCTPRWGYIPFARGESRGFSERWKAFTLINLGRVI